MIGKRDTTHAAVVTRISRVGPRLAIVVGALALALASAAGPAPSRPKVTAAATNASGSVSIGNSRHGTAIVSAAGLRPGAVFTGTVVIENTGDAAGTFWLSKSNITDSPGPLGGVLSGKLFLVVEDVTEANADLLYFGELAAMPRLALRAPFAPKEKRTYKLTVWLPDDGRPASATSGDNAYKGSSVSVEFDWTANVYEVESPVDTTAPVVHLRGPRVHRLRSPRPVRVSASCNEACTISATAGLSTRALRPVKLRPLSRTLTARKWTSLSFRLPRGAIRMARKAAREDKSATLLVKVVAEDGAGNRRIKSKKISLKR